MKVKDDDEDIEVRGLMISDYTPLKYHGQCLYIETSGDIGQDDLNCFALKELLMATFPELFPLRT